MKNLNIFAITLGWVLWGSCLPAQELKPGIQPNVPAAPAISKPQGPFNKVVLIVLENEKYEKALQDPYLAELSKKGALLENYHGVTHPSQPNYIAMVSGGTWGVNNDHLVTVDKKNVADLLEAHDKSWKVYAEDFPGNCSLTMRSKQYAKKHNPLISFKDVQSDPKRCAQIVSADKFTDDVQSNTLPDFSMYIPNQLNDGHDSDVHYASKWLKGFLEPLLKNTALMSDTLIVVTFDENDYIAPGNHIYTVMLGGRVLPGSISKENYNHYSLLRTVEDTFGLGTLNQNDAKATAVTGIWRLNSTSDADKSPSKKDS